MFEAFSAILDLFLPRVCVVCGKKLLLREKYCCLHCLADMPYTNYWRSKHNPMADRYNSRITDETGYALAAALFFYDSGSGYEHITQHLKYEYGIKCGKYFANLLADKILEGGVIEGVDAVIPVPLHKKRLWRRGYNQAEVIASVLALRLNAELVSDALVRKVNTKSQTGVKMENKAENVGSAFSLTKDLNFKHILLVDDVFTSGSTLSACQRAIRRRIPPEKCKISIATLSCVGN